MKKIFLLILLSGILSTIGFSQPTATVTIENPRIDGNRFYFDVYFMRTNDDPDWLAFGNNMLGDCSWYWNFNLTDLDNYVIEEEDPTIFISTSYTNTIGTINGNLRINTVYASVDPTNIELNVWYKAFTVSAEITGDATQLSGLSWDMLNTGLTTVSNQSITETDYDSDCDIALNTKCWDGSELNLRWDDADNWTPAGIPGASDFVIYPNNPLSELGGSNTTYGQINGLRINHLAQMVVPQGIDLTVTPGDVLLKGGVNLVLSSSTNAIPGTLSYAFIPEGTIDYNSYSLENGQIEVHRTLYYEDTDLDYYHHQVAAPVGGVRLGDWDMIHEYSYAYEFDGASQNWVNIHSPFRTTPSGYGFILSLYGASGLPTGTQDNVFYNNLVLSTTSVTVADNAIGDLTLVGNPFTAPIDWEYMNPQTGVSDVVYIWDPAAGNYKSYVEGSGAGSVSARYIQPGQAFFIEASSTTATTFAMDPAARTQNIEPFLKSYMPSLLRMYTEGGNTTDDEVYIKLIDADVTGGHDSGFDALEWPSDYGEQATELYTVGSDGNHLTIDARPLSPDQTSVPLSFKAAVDADYNLVADLESIESFSLGTDIFLEDTHHPEQAWIDLREFNSYTFNASPEDDYNRFMIHFHVKDFGIDEFGESPINIYSDRTDAIIKNNSDQIIKEIHIFDVTGNLMTVKSGVNDEITRMFISSSTGYYVVKVITDKAVYSEKVLITK